MKKTLLGVASVVVLLAASFYFRPEWALAGVERVGARLGGIHSEYVQIGPHRVHYLVAGEGEPLVLVHGLGARAESWMPLIPELTRHHFRIYAPDLLGNGRSDKPDADYSVGMESDVVKDFLVSQKLGPVDIAGWSMGGWIVLNLAARHPELVKRLVVFDGAGMRYHPSANLKALLLPKTPPDLAAMMAILTPHPRPIPEFIARGILREIEKSEWVTARALDSMLSGKDLLDGTLGGVTMPVLLVWGKQDALTPLAVGEAMHREIPQSRLEVFDDCGHLAPARCSDRVRPEMIRFLQAEPPEPAAIQEIPAPVPGSRS